MREKSQHHNRVVTDYINTGAGLQVLISISVTTAPLQKNKERRRYLLKTETGKLKTDGEEGFPGGATDLFREGNMKGKGG